MGRTIDQLRRIVSRYAANGYTVEEEHDEPERPARNPPILLRDYRDENGDRGAWGTVARTPTKLRDLDGLDAVAKIGPGGTSLTVFWGQSLGARFTKHLSPEDRAAVCNALAQRVAREIHDLSLELSQAAEQHERERQRLLQRK